MLVRALGPIELCAAERVITPGGPKPKALLAALTVHVRQVVSIDRLVDLIWDEHPPSSASALIHQYVSQVRRGFAAAQARNVLRTRAPGYLLQLDDTQLDLDVFAQLMRISADAEQAGDPTRAADAYRQALGLWRGPAFGGVDAQFARDHAAGLEAERLTAEEGLARCLLGLGLVTLYREVGDRRGEALALRGLSLCQRAAGDFAEAADRSREAHRILSDAGDVLGATYAAQALAKASLRAGRVEGLRASLEQCRVVCVQHKDRFGIALVTRTLGEFCLATGDLAAARALLTEALELWTTLGLPLWQARTLRDLAAATADDALWAQAMTLFAEMSSRERPTSWRASTRRRGERP